MSEENQVGEGTFEYELVTQVLKPDYLKVKQGKKKVPLLKQNAKGISGDLFRIACEIESSDLQVTGIKTGRHHEIYKQDAYPLPVTFGRPGIYQADDLNLQVYHPLKKADFPNNKHRFYEAIKNSYPLVKQEDIVFFQYYPVVPVNRIERTKFINKLLHAVYNFKPQRVKWVERIYFVDRVHQKPLYVEIPI